MKFKKGPLKFALTALIMFIIFILLQEGDEFFGERKQPIKLPLPNEAEYTERFNKVILKTQEFRNYALKNKTAEKEAKEKSLQQRLINISKTAIKRINFYGRVIDQFGEPVAGVMIKHVGHNAVYSTGSGLMKTTTDDNGNFIVDEAQGSVFTIVSLSKVGYEFSGSQRFSNASTGNKSELVWSNYTKENPFIFKAWKVKEGIYPRISKAGTTYGYTLDKTYSMDFLSSDRRKVKKQGALDLDLQVLFSRDENIWNLDLMVPEGGLIVTEDTFLNMAPADGYQQALSFNGTKKDHMIPINFYIYSRSKYFGRLKVEIRPFMRKGSGLGIDHVMNLDGGRNLEVK